jgi:hypothetical protein
MIKAMKKIFWLLMLLSLAACKARVPTPDPFHMQINGVNLVIPKEYIESSLGIDSNQSRDEINAKAATLPGINVESFITLIETKDLRPWPKNNNKEDISKMTRLTLSFSDKNKPFLDPKFLHEKILKSKRLIEKDVYNLNAYYFLSDSIKYVSNENSENLTIISCGGFGLNNPTCRAITSWNELIVEFDFSYSNFSEWKSIQNKIFNLLKSFLLQ